MNAKYIIKLLTLGDTTVGKSSIVLRFAENRFDDNQFATIGIDFKTKYTKYRDSSVKVLIWDTAGQEKFQNIAKQYYKGANGVLLIYDISKRKSFERVDFWLKELKDNNKIEDLFICLVGNKIDLEDRREIRTEEGESYAKNNNIKFLEVSARSGKNISQLFDLILNGVMAKVYDVSEPIEYDSKVSLSSFMEKDFDKGKTKKCCF